MCGHNNVVDDSPSSSSRHTDPKILAGISINSISKSNINSNSHRRGATNLFASPHPLWPRMRTTSTLPSIQLLSNPLSTLLPLTTPTTLPTSPQQQATKSRHTRPPTRTSPPTRTRKFTSPIPPLPAPRTTCPVARLGTLGDGAKVRWRRLRREARARRTSRSLRPRSKRSLARPTLASSAGPRSSSESPRVITSRKARPGADPLDRAVPCSSCGLRCDSHLCNWDECAPFTLHSARPTDDHPYQCHSSLHSSNRDRYAGVASSGILFPFLSAPSTYSCFGSRSIAFSSSSTS